MKFNCETCDYSTDVKFCYDKHLKTKKHSEKVNAKTVASKLKSTSIQVTSNSFKCQYCENCYATAGNLAKHKKTCIEKNTLIEHYETKIAHKDEIIEAKNQSIADVIAHRETIILENKNLKVLLNCAGTVVEKSMSNLNYINKHYSEAPTLLAITDVPKFSKKFKDANIVNTIINRFKDNDLIEFIGNIILENYKKDDPKLQALWNSDGDRLTYAIKTVLVNNNSYWKVDKKGIDVTKHIIKPILDFLHDKLNIFIKKAPVGKRSDNSSVINNTKLQEAYRVIASIEKGELSDGILKYISPHFFVIRQELALL